jgi:hypothetical protein
MVLDQNVHQGSFGEAFVRTLAAAAGLNILRRDLDVTGVDLKLEYPDELGEIMFPTIDVQVKSWRKTRATSSAGNWTYRMKSKHFNQLAGIGYTVPRFLFLVIVPDHWRDYTRTGPEVLMLSHCAYWVSLHSQERVDVDNIATVAVDVPQKNVVTIDTLLELMKTQVSDWVSL